MHDEIKIIELLKNKGRLEAIKYIRSKISVSLHLAMDIAVMVSKGIKDTGPCPHCQDGRRKEYVRSYGLDDFEQ